MEYEQFKNLVYRADPLDKPHERTGNTSKFTSSKAYTALPKLTAADKKAGYRGIYCGPLSTGYVEAPPYEKAGKKNTRDTIRSAVFDVKEEREENPYFDHGNTYENVAIQQFRAVCNGGPSPFYDSEMQVIQTGRIDCSDPKYPWMAATPDSILYWKKQTWVLEVKCAVTRNVITSDIPPIRVMGFFGNYLHEECDYNIEEGDVIEGEIVETLESGKVIVKKWYEYFHATVYQQSLIPAHYVFQLLLECKSTGLPRALFLQFNPGGPFREPQLHFTEWDFDQKLFDRMLVYWSKCWLFVEEGRKEYQRLKEKNDVKGLIEFNQNFPWPEPKKGTRVKNEIPFLFDK